MAENTRLARGIRRRLYRDKCLNPRRAAPAAALQAHIDEGTIRNDVDADTLIRIMSNTMLGGIIAPDEATTTTRPELIVDLFLGGLLTGAAHSPPNRHRGNPTRAHAARRDGRRNGRVTPHGQNRWA